MSSIRELKKGANVPLSANFSSNEYDCKCKYSDCTRTLVDMEHIKKLQEKRAKWKKPIIIESAYRCEKHNNDVGGATNSRHKEGDATDIKVVGMDPDKVAMDCEEFRGLGRYSTFTHIDSRPLPEGEKARWDFRPKRGD